MSGAREDRARALLELVRGGQLEIDRVADGARRAHREPHHIDTLGFIATTVAAFGLGLPV
jgi:hypothetical protein